MTAPRQPKWMTVTGWGLAVLISALLTFSATMKFLMPPDMLKEIERMGYSGDMMRNIGVVELACAVIFLVPQTSVLGAILIAGYLGGATATHVRIGDPLGQALMPVIAGVLAWLALFLRDRRIRALIPWRTSERFAAPTNS